MLMVLVLVLIVLVLKCFSGTAPAESDRYNMFMKARMDKAWREYFLKIKK